MSSLNYTTYVQQIANLLVVASSDLNFQTMLPGMIDYSEQRIYRELDLLYTQVTDATTQVSSGVRDFTLPTDQGSFITVDNLNIILPAGALSSQGSRVPLTPVDRSFIDLVYPSGQTITDTPAYFARASETVVIFGPSPDAAYYAEVVGIQRPASLSSANSSTILTQYIPDVFIAASMVFGTAYQRDFGAQADDPGRAQSWESQYQTLSKSAGVEQARAKFEAEGWTSESPSPTSTPPRV